MSKSRKRNKEHRRLYDQTRRAQRREHIKKYRAEHPDYVKRHKNLHYEKRKKILHELKDAHCVDCSVRYPPYIMQFDHVPDRGEKKFCVGASFYAYSLEVMLEEIAKCDLVCANCHAERTHQRKNVQWSGKRNNESTAE